MERTASNPLANLAFQIPAATSRGASITGRLFGAGLAILVVVDQSYEPTQVFAGFIAALVLVTLFPLRGAPGDWLAAFGAGSAFFAGTLLTHMGAGAGLLAMGAIAATGGFAFAHREGRNVTLPALVFIAAVLVVAGLQVVVVFSFE